MAEYRIVRDTYAGFEVQVRRWWFPFWIQVGFTNTHSTLAAAERWARNASGEEVKRLNLKDNNDY